MGEDHAKMSPYRHTEVVHVKECDTCTVLLNERRKRNAIIAAVGFPIILAGPWAALAALTLPFGINVVVPALVTALTLVAIICRTVSIEYTR